MEEDQIWGNGTQGQGGGGNRTQYFEGYCNNCGVWGHKSNNCWHKEENAHLCNASYRPLQNQEATGANVEIVLPSIEIGSEEELYCTQVEMESKIEVYCEPCVEESENFKESQGEATSASFISELSNSVNVEAKEGKVKLESIIMLSELSKVFEV